MRTVRLLTVCRSLLPAGGRLLRGVSAPWGEVSAPGGVVSAPGGSGLGGVWSGGGLVGGGV